MIYELRTYDIFPTRMPEYLAHIQSDPDINAILSPHLKAFFQTEFGPLNQVIHLYQYNSLEHRREVRGRLPALPQFPAFSAKLREFIAKQENKLLAETPLSPPLA
jgi:hypothetical protein